jgi:hypothetical protein
MITIRYNREWQEFQVVDPENCVSYHDNVEDAYDTAKYLQEKYKVEIRVSSSAKSRVNTFLKRSTDA